MIYAKAPTRAKLSPSTVNLLKNIALFVFLTFVLLAGTAHAQEKQKKTPATSSVPALVGNKVGVFVGAVAQGTVRFANALVYGVQSGFYGHKATSKNVTPVGAHKEQPAVEVASEQ